MLWDVTGGPGLEKSECKRWLKLWDHIGSVCAQAEEKMKEYRGQYWGASVVQSQAEKKKLHKGEKELIKNKW